MKKPLTKYAKSLKRDATQAEKVFWRHLKARQMEGVKFRRQQPIDHYIVDFVSFETRLVIELDGGQHAINREKDIKRDQYLTDSGFKVLRFLNTEVLRNIEGVLEVIRRECLCASSRNSLSNFLPGLPTWSRRLTENQIIPVRFWVQALSSLLSLSSE